MQLRRDSSWPSAEREPRRGLTHPFGDRGGHPGKKSGPPEDLVGTLLLLCSKAGDWINGQSISVDGGWVMRL